MASNNEAPYKEFGERLAKLRREKGLTRAELGELCGVAPSTMLNYERGLRVPFADTAIKMAHVFDMTADDLLNMTNPAIEMAKAEALENMRLVNGSRGLKQMQRLFDGALADFAGGVIDDDLFSDYAYEMNKMALIMQQKLREKYSNRRYQATVDAKAAETEEMVKHINETIIRHQIDD